MLNRSREVPEDSQEVGGKNNNMKRKTLLSISVAVVLVVAMAATAFASADSSISVSGPGSISTGETIQITVNGTGLGVNADLSVSGLTIDSISNAFSGNSGVVLLPAFGTSSVTYTCTVTAGAGETASFVLSNAQATGDNDDVFSISGDSWSATVPSASTPTDTPTDQPTDEPSSTPSNGGSGSNGGSSSGNGGSSSNGGSSTGSGNADKMPKTGDATMDLWVLAVVAAGCAGAAVVAGKKVFAK